MAEKLGPRQVVTFEELVLSLMHEQKATRRILVSNSMDGGRVLNPDVHAGARRRRRNKEPTSHRKHRRASGEPRRP